MIKIINSMLSILRIILLLACFVFSFFIIVSMYQRLEKDLVKAIFNFVPFVILFILFAINIVLKQKSVNQCTFYNITCCLVFTMILFAAYRTFFDTNMIALTRLGYKMNFNYFADIIAPMKAMLYMLSVSNVLLMVEGMDFKKLYKLPEEEVKENKKKEKIELTAMKKA